MWSHGLFKVNYIVAQLISENQVELSSMIYWALAFTT